MSKIEVDTIAPQSGTTVTVGESGDTVTIPTGVTLDASNATTTLPANVVTTDGTQTLTNKSIAATQLTGTVATSNLGTGTADATTFLRGDQTYASATPAAGSITTTQLAYNPNSFRNIIINGDMSIAQRATSTSSITGSGYYTIDRFYLVNGGMGTWTQSQSTDVPTGQGFATSLKMDCTTADASPAASDELVLRQQIEGQNLQYLKKGTASAESLTLSFWIKATKTGTNIVELFDFDNTRQISQSYTISSANTWEKKTVTFAGDTSGVLDNDNGASFGVQFSLGAGSNFTSGTLSTTWTSSTNADRFVGQVNHADSISNEWYITGIQLEAGTSASDFEFLPYDVNLQRCLRYCWKHGGEASNQYLNAQGSYNDANYLAFGLVSPPVPMRAAPSVTENGSVIVHRLNTDYTGWNWGFITGVQSQSWFVSGEKASHGVTAASSVIKCPTTSDFLLYSAEL